MTGTAIADAYEFEAIYGPPVVPVPTARARRGYPDVAFRTRKGANDAWSLEVASRMVVLVRSGTT
jgi:preprotein translocase subunit SecA